MDDGPAVFPMSLERRRWLERLVGVCERVAAGAPASTSDPHLGAVLEDIEALRLRLVAQLAAADDSTW